MLGPLRIGYDPPEIWAVYHGLTVRPRRAAFAADAGAATPELDIAKEIDSFFTIPVPVRTSQHA